MTTVADLAHRFRPFLKCSLARGEVDGFGV